jgi:hypothetical protein
MRRSVCRCMLLILLPVHGALAQSMAVPLRSTGAPLGSSETVGAASALLPVSTEAALQSMFAEAAVVFTGEVIYVHAEGGFMEVRFRVDDAVRGVRSGAVYVLREWSGLWTDGARYRVGDRRLMLLHAASAAGLASPVGGADGVIPVSGDAVSGEVDLRWIATLVVRQLKPPAVVKFSLGNSAEADVAHTDRGVVMDLLHAWQRVAVER